MGSTNSPKYEMNLLLKFLLWNLKSFLFSHLKKGFSFDSQRHLIKVASQKKPYNSNTITPKSLSLFGFYFSSIFMSPELQSPRLEIQGHLRQKNIVTSTRRNLRAVIQKEKPLEDVQSHWRLYKTESNKQTLCIRLAHHTPLTLRSKFPRKTCPTGLQFHTLMIQLSHFKILLEQPRCVWVSHLRPYVQWSCKLSTQQHQHIHQPTLPVESHTANYSSMVMALVSFGFSNNGHTVTTLAQPLLSF